MDEVQNVYIDCRKQGMNVEYDEFLAVFCSMRNAGYEVVSPEKIDQLNILLVAEGVIT